jgi:cytochrome c-type biogenesis protein
MIAIALPSSLWASVPIALAAGFVSFLSPCVLPLLPGYIAFLGGATNGLDSKRGRGRAIVGACAFVLGFAVVFISFGAAFGSFGATLKTHQRTLEVVFGVVTVILGFFFAGWWPSKWLARDARSHRLPRASVVGAFALGFLFALGWTPCIGPTLAAILGLAASSSGTTAWRGSFLALVYCIGLGLPFVVAALATEWMAHASAWLRRRQKMIGRIGGVMLILIGLSEVTGWWQSFVLWLQTTFPSSSSFL